MSFLVPLGLLLAFGIVGPLIAHLIRRKKPETIVFPPVRFVAREVPVARRRAYLEDRVLFAIRALSVLVLAAIAASPLIRCSRFAFDRAHGASIATVLIIDDSMSMQAELRKEFRRGGAKTRFELAIVAAQELVSSLRSGDAAAIVLAGSPARTLVSLTHDIKIVATSLSQLKPSDRATDLEGALVLATASLQETPQPDRRILLFSDLADGSHEKTWVVPTAQNIRFEVPLEALKSEPTQGFANCALLAATSETRDSKSWVRVKVGCALNTGVRTIEVLSLDRASKILGSSALPSTAPLLPQTFEVQIPLSETIKTSSTNIALQARLVGQPDALVQDDFVPVLHTAVSPVLGVVVGEGGALDEIGVTGGPPVLERALNALETGFSIRPLPSIPDRESDFSSLVALAIDDPSGFSL